MCCSQVVCPPDYCLFRTITQSGFQLKIQYFFSVDVGSQLHQKQKDIYITVGAV